MEESRTNSELTIRAKVKELVKLFEENSWEKGEKLLSENPEIFNYNFGLNQFFFILPLIRNTKSNSILKKHIAIRIVINCGYEINRKQMNYDNLLFFAAAKCDSKTIINSLREIEKKHNNKNSKNDVINQIYQGDPILLFLLKYGELSNENFTKTVQTLIENGVDVNKCDYKNRSPISYLLYIFEKQAVSRKTLEITENNVRTSIILLLKTKKINISETITIGVNKEEKSIESIIKEHNLLEIENYIADNAEFEPKNSINEKLFEMLIKRNETKFTEFRKIKEYKDINDGNNTLLQLCCELNLIQAAKHLIKNEADLMKTTNANKKTPLELVALRNYEEIFDALLDSNRVEISADFFYIFVINRPKHIKAKYFDKILKYKNLNVNIKISNSGNTPLHYAIIFASTEAIPVLLHNGASLLVKNNAGKTPLDYISTDDLELFFNSCILPDHYENDTSSGKYEIALNYRNFIEFNEDQSEITSEISVVEKISESDELRDLINHPLILTLCEIKWSLVKSLYVKLFFMNILLYACITFAFVNLYLIKFVAIPLALIYGTKTYIFFNWDKNKFHEIIDILICFILVFSVCISHQAVQYTLGIVTALLLALSCHLFWRFNPDFSKFHASLVLISTQLLSYGAYLLILCLFFGAASHIFHLSQKDLIDDQNNSIINSYYLYCVFVVAIMLFLFVMTGINAFLCIQENFTTNIKKNSNIIGCKNVTIFLKNIETIYLNNKLAPKLIPSPFLFETIDEKNKIENVTKKIGKKKMKRKEKNRVQCIVSYKLNLNKFTFEKLLKFKLSFYTVNKIKNMVNKQGASADGV